jgi:hypothetical protein
MGVAAFARAARQAPKGGSSLKSGRASIVAPAGPLAPPKKLSLLQSVKSLASPYSQVTSPNLTPMSGDDGGGGFAEDEEAATSPPHAGNERKEQKGKAALLPALREGDESELFA